ncbi:MAG: hypothetical protein HY747_10285, partial [Elusimicrobia bacterium]|nr:hypothetical protein [Elusimicrobiota bacterium]
ITYHQITLCRLMMGEDEPDRKTLASVAGKINELRGRREEKTLDHLLAMRQVLNPRQQRKLLAALMKDFCCGCRMAGGKKCLCGMCGLGEEKGK